MKCLKRDDEPKRLLYTRYVVYGLFLVVYLSYLAYLIYNLVTDKPLVKAERSILNRAYVPGKIH